MSLSDSNKITLVVLISFSALLVCFEGADSVVSISPSPRAAVCRVGDHLEVVCTATESIVDWNVAFWGTSDRTRIDSTVTSTQLVQDVRTSHSTVFIFSRTSELGTLPLISTLEISSVTSSLNGSTISCMESSSVVMEMTTTIYIIGDSDAFLPDIDPSVISIEEQFGTDSVIVLLQWQRELNNSLISYLVSVVPMDEAMITTSHGSNRANVTVPYNSLHSIRVVADFCGRINAFLIIEVHYANCGDPLKQHDDHKDADSVIALGYSNLALEGNSIDLKCPPGLMLLGPNVSTCMENGEWEPDLGEVECEATSVNCGQPPSPPTNGHILPYTNTLEGAEVMYVCLNIHQEANISLCAEANTTAVCNEHSKWEPESQDLYSIFSGRSDEVLSRDGKIAVASSVTIFTMVSIIFFTIGFLCGHFSQKKRKSSTAAAGSVLPSGRQTQIPCYDDVVLQQEVELKENVAYAPIR